MGSDRSRSALTGAHFTARRGFVAAAGFGLVSLYLLWAAYGAAPLGFGAGGHGEAGRAQPPGGHGEAGHGQPPGGHGEAGHGQPPAGGHGEAGQAQGAAGGHGEAPAGEGRAQIADFRSRAERFAEQYRLPDGSVRPGRARAAALAPKPEAGGHAGDAHDHGAPQPAMGAAQEAPGAAQQAQAGEGPVEVYLMAYRFGFLPAVLRLEAGVPYRFRMMAVDVAHGASVRVGPGAHIVRLRPGVLVEQEFTFERAGEYLLYCTVYCGVAHGGMQGRIVVSEKGAGS